MMLNQLVISSPLGKALIEVRTALEEARRTGKIVIDLALDYDVGLSFTHPSEEEFEQNDGPLLQNVRKEGIELR